MLDEIICFIGADISQRLQQSAALFDKLIEKTTIEILVDILSKKSIEEC